MGMPDAPDVWGHVKPWREEVSLGQERATAGKYKIEERLLLLGENSETKSCRLPGKLDIHSPRQTTSLMVYLAKVPIC